MTTAPESARYARGGRVDVPADHRGLLFNGERELVMTSDGRITCARLTTAPDVVEYECPECHRLWPSAAVRDGCCTWDDE